MSEALLGEEEIQASGLVEDSRPSGYRATTYDLSIAEIVPADPAKNNGEVVDTYVLEPGGTVRVVSRESLKLPNTITAHVLLKNDLCRKGILAINIGVVDPGFEGPLSSTLINFGRSNFIVKRDDPFLRVSFFHCKESTKAALSQKWNRSDYLSRVRDEVLAYATPTFLDIENTTQKAADKMYERMRNRMFAWSGVIAVIFAAITILVPLGASYADRVLSERREAEKSQKEVTSQYEKRIKALETSIEKLKSASENKAPSLLPKDQDAR